MSIYKVQYGDNLNTIAKANNTTLADLLKANPNITDPNKITAGASLNIGVPTTVPTTAVPAKPSTPAAYVPPQPPDLTPEWAKTTKTPTIADKASMVPDLKSEDPTLQAYYDEQKTQMTNPIDEKSVREQVRQRYQSQIDALRIAAAQKIAEEKIAGEGRKGSARSIQARSGTLGSSFSTSENNQIDDRTKEIIDLTNAETEAKISLLLGQTEKDASEQIAAQKAAKKAGADEYIAYLGKRDSIKLTQATNLAKLYASQGTDITKLTPADKEKLKSVYGIDEATFSKMINDEKTAIQDAKDKKIKENTFDLSEGQSKYVYDPITGKTKVIASKAKTYAPSSGGGGDKLLSVAEANAAGVPYGTTERQLINKTTGPVDTSKSMAQIDLAKRSLANAKALASASGDTSFFNDLKRKAGGATKIDNLTAETNTLRTNILTMATDPSIKKFFGPQMSNADVLLMTSAGTTLNPELQSPAQMKEELTRLEDLVNRAEAAVKNGQAQTQSVPTQPQEMTMKGVTYVLQADGTYLPKQ